jgi:hypothetical protein
LKLSIERKTKINIKKSIEIEHAAPLLDTPKGFPFTAVHNSQGNGNLQVKNINIIDVQEHYRQGFFLEANQIYF